MIRSMDEQTELDFAQDEKMVKSGRGESHVVVEGGWCGNFKLFENLFVDAA